MRESEIIALGVIGLLLWLHSQRQQPGTAAQPSSGGALVQINRDAIQQITASTVVAPTVALTSSIRPIVQG